MVCFHSMPAYFLTVSDCIAYEVPTDWLSTSADCGKAVVSTHTSHYWGLPYLAGITSLHCIYRHTWYHKSQYTYTYDYSGLVAICSFFSSLYKSLYKHGWFSCPLSHCGGVCWPVPAIQLESLYKWYIMYLCTMLLYLFVGFASLRQFVKPFLPQQLFCLSPIWAREQKYLNTFLSQPTS